MTEEKWPSRFGSFLWVNLYHKPRLKFDREYREGIEEIENLIRKAYERGIIK